MTVIQQPNHARKNPSFELRLRVLSAIDYAPGDTIVARIKSVSERTFSDAQTNATYQFTWRTIIYRDVMYAGFAGAKTCKHLAVPF
jgi:hypothetical protein